MLSRLKKKNKKNKKKKVAARQLYFYDSFQEKPIKMDAVCKRIE